MHRFFTLGYSGEINYTNDVNNDRGVEVRISMPKPITYQQRGAIEDGLAHAYNELQPCTYFVGLKE